MSFKTILSIIAFTVLSQGQGAQANDAKYKCDLYRISYAGGMASYALIGSKEIEPAQNYVGDIHNTGELSYHLDNQNIFGGGLNQKLGIVVLKNYYLGKAFYSAGPEVSLNDYDSMLRISCSQIVQK